MKMRLFISIIIVSILTLACGVSSSNTSTSSKSVASDIESATTEQIEKLSSAIEHNATISNFKTVKSKDFDNVYFVSAIITDSTGGKLNGLWATGGKTEISMIMSANGAARQYSPWPYGPDTSSKVNAYDDGGQLLLDSY